MEQDPKRNKLLVVLQRVSDVGKNGGPQSCSSAMGSSGPQAGCISGLAATLGHGFSPQVGHRRNLRFRQLRGSLELSLRYGGQVEAFGRGIHILCQLCP